MGRLADGHMTSTLASSWGECRQAWPLDLSMAIPAPSWLDEQPAETQGGRDAPRKSQATVPVPVPVRVPVATEGQGRALQ